MSDPMQSVINPAAAFFRPPAAPPPAAPAAPKIFSPEERIGTAEKLIEQSRQKESEAALALGKRQQEEAVFKAEQEAKLAKGEAELERKAKEGIEGSEAYQLQQDIEKEIAQARFAPTQRTAQENMMMMALINLVGFGIGAGGKGNSMAALGAMTGMLDGVQKGDMARYKQERETFETNLKALHERAVRVDTLLKRVADLQTRDKTAAQLELRAGLAAEGADWLRQYGDKFGLVKQQELSAQIRRDAEKMRDVAQKAKDAEDRAIAERKGKEELRKLILESRQTGAKFVPAGMDAQGNIVVMDTRSGQVRVLEGVKPKSSQMAGKPILFEGPEGKAISYDPNTKQFTTLDLPAGVAKLTPVGKAGQTSALLATRAENIRESFVQAAKDLENLSKLPPNTALGAFAGLTGKSGDTLVQSLKTALARGVTDTDSRQLQILLAGIEGHLSFALGGGYASSQSKARMDQYKDQLARYGDDPIIVATMLARLRQEMNILAENFTSKPGASKEMAKAVTEANERINKAVPFTVEDVIAATYGKVEQSAKIPGQPVPAAVAKPSERPASAPETAKQAPDGNWYAPDPNRPGKYIKY